MKEFFFNICIGCFCVMAFNYMYGFWCGFWGKETDPYVMGFFGCLFWWIVLEFIEKDRGIK